MKASVAQTKFLNAILKHGGYRVPASKVFHPDELLSRRQLKTVTVKSCRTRGWVHREETAGGVALWSVTTEGRLAAGVSPVGPDGVGGWYHTDGKVYLHDPATSAYKRYDEMVPGDVIDWTGRATVEVLRVNEPYTETAGPLAGRQCLAHWCRRLSDGKEGYVPFGPAGMAPVRLAELMAG